jgi:hypothetical protein
MKNSLICTLIGVAVILGTCFSNISAQVDSTRYDTTRYDIIRTDTTRYDTIRIDTARYDTIRTTTSTTTRYDNTDDNDYNSKPRFGIRVGLIIARQTFEDGNLDENASSKFGADIAAVLNIPVGEGYFMFQPELHWLQKGSQIDDIDEDDIGLNYLELPLLLRLNFGDEAKVFVLGGPSIGFLLGTGDDLDRDDFNDTEWGLHLGLGLGFEAVEFDVRYMAGLSDISAVDGDLSEIKISAFGVGLTLKF